VVPAIFGISILKKGQSVMLSSGSAHLIDISAALHENSTYLIEQNNILIDAY